MMISTVSDYLACLGRKEDDGPTGDLYRGQADSAWKVDCSAVRRLESCLETNLATRTIGHALVGYLDGLLKEAARFIGTCQELPRGCSDLDLLAQLQHQGAATGLIDFTLDPLVALWFACAGHPEKDGAVYVLSRSKTQEIDEMEVRHRGIVSYFYAAGLKDWTDLPYLWTPKSMHGRPTSQQSVFIFGVPFIWPVLLKKAVIENGMKSSLLEELGTGYGITEEGLFADLAGYAQANGTSKFFDTTRTVQFWIEQTNRMVANTETPRVYVDCGLAYAAIGDHERAVQQFTKAIGVDPAGIVGYANRATAKRSRGDLKGALADYSSAIRNHLEHHSGAGSNQIRAVYWNRGQTHVALGQEDEGYSDMNEALKLGYTLYLNEKNEGEDKINAYPDDANEYELITVSGNGKEIID